MLSRNCKGPGLQQKRSAIGKAADDVLGHWLYFPGNRFQIMSKDGKPLYAGTEGELKREAVGNRLRAHGGGPKRPGRASMFWTEIRLRSATTHRTWTKGRPDSFETKSGSGYEVITFQRAALNRA
jgi:hypothetical protein